MSTHTSQSRSPVRRISAALLAMLLVFSFVLPGSLFADEPTTTTPPTPETDPGPFILLNRSEFVVNRIPRNPFVPIDYRPDASPGDSAPRQKFTIPQGAFKVSSIMLDPVEPLAIINGKTFGLGEKIPFDAGAGIIFNLEVLRIYDGGVDLGFRGESLAIPLERRSSP